MCHTVTSCVQNWNCMYACSSRVDEQVCTKLGMLMSWDQEDFTKGQNSKILSWVWVLVMVVPVTWNMVQGWCQDQNCLFLWGEQRLKPWKSVLGLSPIESGFCSSETNHDILSHFPCYSTILNQLIKACDKLSGNKDWWEMKAFAELPSNSTVGIACLAYSTTHTVV